MKIVKELAVIGMALIVGIGVYGCGMKKHDSDGEKNNNKSNQKIELVLNERQKEILKEMGLTTEVKELDSSQKQAIIAIEEMLSEMEKKYHTSFSYAGYIEPGPLENEQLIAYPSEGNEEDSFIVTRTKENGMYIYDDEYANVLAKHVYTPYILEYCQSQLGEENVKIYSIITNIKEKKTQFKEKDIADNISGESCIFVDGGRIAQEDYKEFLSDYKAWISEHGVKDNTEFILLKEGILEKVMDYNYTDYLSEEYYLRDDCLE